MKAILSLLILSLSAASAIAQINVQAGGNRVTIGQDIGINVDAKDVTTAATNGSTASVTVGGIEGGANVQGVTVINGKVWIDGKEIPPNVTRYKSKSGTVYRIERKGGAVSVASE